MNALVPLLLRLTGQGAWSPFFRVLSNQGRPSPVFFPPELVEQGLGFALTGLTNTFAFQGHAAWVLPWWAEQQLRPDSEAFIPSGVNVLTANLTHRNWTALAERGAPWKAMVDPCGMLTPRAFGPSWLPCLETPAGRWIPSRLGASSLEQGLADGWRPRVLTRYRVQEGLAWTGEAAPLRAGGRDWVVWTHRLRWSGEGDLEAAFTLGLRPYNVLTLGPVFRSRVKGPLWSVNRQAAMLLSRAPDAAWFGKGREDPLLGPEPEAPPARGRARDGWLGGAARWRVRLRPGEAWELEARVLVPAEEGRIRWRSLDLAEVARAAPAPDPGDAPLGFRCAREDLVTAVRALAGRLAAFDNGGHFAPGAFFYNHAWLRDGAFLALAHDLWGLHGPVAAKEARWMDAQRWAGHFSSHSGEWDGTGQTLVTWTHHALLSGDPGVLARNWRRFARGARWLARARRRGPEGSAHAGLLPAGLSAEHFGPNDHYYWDNFWALAGLERLHGALGAWGEAPPAALRFRDWLGREAAAYRALLEAGTAAQAARHGGLLPASPYRHPDAAGIGTLAALDPLDLGLGGGWARANADDLLAHWVREGLFYQPIIHTGANPYLTAQLARALQALGDPRWADLLEGILAAATPTFAWPEAIHLRTGGGCMGDGDHGWAAAEALALVRRALVREQAGRLLLLPGTPEAWWRGGALALEDAPTAAGRLTFALRPGPEGTFRLDWRLRRDGFRIPLPLHLALPGGWTAPGEAVRTPWGSPALALPDAGTLDLRPA